MQSVPSRLFPELQREAEAQIEEACRRSRTPSEGRGGLGSRAPPPTSSSPFEFSATRHPATPPPPPPSPSSLKLDDAPPVPTRRKTARRRSSAGTQLQDEHARLESDAGSGTGRALSWASPAEEVSPQFIGRSAASDADFLISHPSLPQLSVRQYQSDQLANTAAQLQSLLSHTPALSPPPVPLPQIVESLIIHPDPPSPPVSEHHYYSPPETSSDTTSFAYALVRREDRRLFRNSTKPPQHQRPKPSDHFIGTDASWHRPKFVRSPVKAKPVLVTSSPRLRPNIVTPVLPSARVVGSSSRKPLRRTTTFVTRVAATPAQHRASGDFQKPTSRRPRLAITQEGKASSAPGRTEHEGGNERSPASPTSRLGVSPGDGKRMLSFFRKTAFNKDIFDGIPTPKTPASHSATPEIKVIRSNDQTPILERPPYFARGRGHASESTGSSSHISPMSSESHEQRPCHTRSSTELSPLSTPRFRPRPRLRKRHTPKLDSFEDDDVDTAQLASNHHDQNPATGLPLGTTSEVSIERPHSQTSKRRQSLWKRLRSVSSLRSKLGELASSIRHSISIEPLSHLPSRVARSTSSTKARLRRSASWISQVVVQKIPLADHNTDTSSYSAHNSIVTSHELAHVSTNTMPLSAKPSFTITEADLEVTAFEQTPFSQRYHDAIRSEAAHTRLLVEEAMAEDREDESEVLLGFEVDVPDHLPNSILCPLHPRHRSGGKAICPLHGVYRRRVQRRFEHDRGARSRGSRRSGVFGGANVGVGSGSGASRVIGAASAATGSGGSGASASGNGTAHKIEIVYDTREQLKRGTSYYGSDGGGADGVVLSFCLCRPDEKSGACQEL